MLQIEWTDWVGMGSGEEPWLLVGVFLLWTLIFRCCYLSNFLPSFWTEFTEGHFKMWKFICEIYKCISVPGKIEFPYNILFCVKFA